MTITTAIANHLNIVESVITQVEEWASVLFVRFVKGSPRFVSKKIGEGKMEMEVTFQNPKGFRKVADFSVEDSTNKYQVFDHTSRAAIGDYFSNIPYDKKIPFGDQHYCIIKVKSDNTKELLSLKDFYADNDYFSKALELCIKKEKEYYRQNPISKEKEQAAFASWDVELADRMS